MKCTTNDDCLNNPYGKLCINDGGFNDGKCLECYEDS